MIRVLFSYSHRDEDLRDELEIHLSSLRRQGLIEAWHDRRIGAGDEIDPVIDENLESADVILLLVSPYFIASDYCYNIEMKRAMERHEEGKARVIPVILSPCDWPDLPFGKLNAVPEDGKPITKFANYHDGFLQVIKAIKKAAIELDKSEQQPLAEIHRDPPTKESVANELPRSSNLRTRKTFTDQEKDQFIKNAFEYFSNYFEGSLSELEKRNPQITTKFVRVDIHHFIASIYYRGERASECRVWLPSEGYSRNSIKYSKGSIGNDGGCNEALSLDDDGYVMFLKPLGMLFPGEIVSEEEHQNVLNYEGGAEYLWSDFIRGLQ